MLPGMDASELTTSEVSELHERLRLMFHYLASLQKRMEERQFYGDDRLYLEVRTARYALQLHTKDLHRLACGPSYGGKKLLDTIMRRERSPNQRRIVVKGFNHDLRDASYHRVFRVANTQGQKVEGVRGGGKMCYPLAG